MRQDLFVRPPKVSADLLNAVLEELRKQGRFTVEPNYLGVQVERSAGGVSMTVPAQRREIWAKVTGVAQPGFNPAVGPNLYPCSWKQQDENIDGTFADTANGLVGSGSRDPAVEAVPTGAIPVGAVVRLVEGPAYLTGGPPPTTVQTIWWITSVWLPFVKIPDGATPDACGYYAGTISFWNPAACTWNDTTAPAKWKDINDGIG